MKNMYIFSVVLLWVISFKINYLYGAVLNSTNEIYLENQLQRTIRQVVRNCKAPTIPNGSVNILKQNSSPKIKSLFINIACESNFILQPEEDNLFCVNGFWDVDKIPECKKCEKRSYTTVIGETMDSQLICPESLDDDIFIDCGQRKYGTHQPFIVNGTISKFAEFPWHVAIYKKDQNDPHPMYQCGGSIITEKSILTVAHCFADGYGNIITSREYHVAAGKFHRNYNSDRVTTQNRKVAKLTLHPRYKGEYTNYAWDIAVLTVDRPFQISSIVLPVCIDWKNLYENEHLSTDIYGEIAGWGKTEKNLNDASLELRVLKVPFINTEQCNKHVPNTFLKYITHDKFCAGYMNGSSVCDGDSGGGFVFERQEKGKIKYYIRGLVSLGIQKDSYCDSYKYSTYTKVSEYISFIREAIQYRNDTTTESSEGSSTTTNLPESSENSTEIFVPCKTPNEEGGKCISLYDCKVFVDALQKNPTSDVIKFINESNCGTLEEKNVCCGSVTYYRKCIPPIVKNGQVKLIKQILNQDVNVLLANVVCDDNYVLQYSQYVIICSNGNWDYEQIPKCIKCVNSYELSDIDENTDTQLICPDSLNYLNCGQRNYGIHQPFVVKGTLSKFAEFPWHVAIYRKDQNDPYPTYQCAGSIINKQSILTVAHCFSDHNGNLISTGEYFVAAGKFHRNFNSDRETTQIRKVVKIDLHPRYKGSLTNYGWDIAVVTVDEPFNITTIVHPVCIDWETNFENEHLSSNNYGEIAGWGNANDALQLRALKVPFINIDECVKFSSDKLIRFLTHDKFCAGYLNCSSIGKGDSGAGLVFERQVMGETKYYIRGLLSVGLPDNNNYNIYTKVSDHISFIRKSIENTNITTTVLSTYIDLLKSLENSTEPIVSCETPNKEEAKCINLYDCKIFAYALQKFPTPDVINFIKDSQCGKLDERKVCCGSSFKKLSVIHSNPVTIKPFEHSNLHLLPKPGVCGRQTQVRDNRMYGETIAELMDFPWMALLDYGAYKYNDLCSGFLINEKYLLTLATCLRININRVRLGEYDLTTDIDCVNITRGTGFLPNGRMCTDPPVDVDIEEIIIHPLFSNRTKINDIALIRLTKNISYTDFIRPICLPLNGEMSLPWKQMIVSKWESEKNVKLKYFLSAITAEECIKKYDSDVLQTKTINSYVCAGYEEPKKKCIGDFGGPLMTTFSNSNYIYAEGIVAFSAGRCGEYPIIATKLTSFMNWILDNLKP